MKYYYKKPTYIKHKDSLVQLAKTLSIILGVILLTYLLLNWFLMAVIFTSEYVPR